MKKLFTVAILGLLSTGAFAQTTQGTKVISGSVGISVYSNHLSNGDIKYSNSFIQFYPTMGYLLKDNLEAGVSLGYLHSKSKFSEDGESSDYKRITTGNVYSFSPYLKKYIPLSEKFALSGSLSAGLRIGKEKDEFTTDHSTITEEKSNGYFASFIPGVSYFISEKIGLTASFGNVGYSKITTEDENSGDKTTLKSFGFDLRSSTFGFGFSYHF
jgi:hypothetical protein